MDGRRRIKPLISFGETDDFSYNIVEAPVHLNELNATILHCLDLCLTGVEPARVVRELLV